MITQKHARNFDRALPKQEETGGNLGLDMLIASNGGKPWAGKSSFFYGLFRQPKDWVTRETLASTFQEPHTLDGFVQKSRGCPEHSHNKLGHDDEPYLFLGVVPGFFPQKSQTHPSNSIGFQAKTSSSPRFLMHCPSDTRCGAILGTSPVIIANEMLGPTWRSGVRIFSSERMVSG